MRVVAALCAALFLAGCGSSGTAYRGAPPPGMTDAEYRCELLGAGCAAAPGRWAEMKDDSSGQDRGGAEN